MAGADGLLEDRDLDILESWIGTGPKQFNLLYKITRDGCNAATFHQKCDGQGPTMTVLYNTHGTVYGGYVSQSWNNSNGAYITDHSAFLFQLKYNKSVSYKKFSIKGDCVSYALYSQFDYGPRFGAGADLHTFSENVDKSSGTFSLNGCTNWNRTFETQGLTAATINNDTLVVNELEVYKVMDGSKKAPRFGPWRELPPMNYESVEELQQFFLHYKPLCASRVPQARILLVGPVGAGKSSFYNTINSAFRGRLTYKAISGSSDSSLTNVFTHYQIIAPPKTKLKFRLCDTRGLEEGQGTDTNEFCYLLDGHIPEYYQFNTSASIKADQIITRPTFGQKMHCVVFVLDATTLDVLPSGILQKIKSFQGEIYQRGLPQLVLLTKVDKLCESVEEDPANIFESETVEDAVDKAAELFRIPRGNVLPVKNYENEGLLKTSVSVTALFALQQILNFTDDYLEYHQDREAIEEKGVKQLDIKD